MYKNILVALQNLEDARPVLSKAAALSKKDSSDVHMQVTRVVYESLADLSSKYIDQSVELKKFVLEAEEPLLEDAVRQVNLNACKIETSTVWHKHIWEGIIHAAAADHSDLILKPRTDDKSTLYPHPPEDWNLIRHSTVPVLLTRSNTWPIKPSVVAAVDIFDEAHQDLNKAILDEANKITQLLGGNLHIVSAFPLLSIWINEVATIKNYERLRDEMAAESTADINTICQALHIDDYTIHTTEGLTDDVIEKLVKSVKASLLIMGTKARKGLTGYLIGNTAEQILSHLQIDIMTVPTPAGTDKTG